jgi:hypothetical protein
VKPYLIEQQDSSLLLTVYIQPRASRNRIAGLHGEAVKLCITAPPVDGKANSAVVAYLADLFSLPKQDIALKSGRQSRTKRLVIKNISLTEATRLLGLALGL